MNLVYNVPKQVNVTSDDIRIVKEVLAKKSEKGKDSA
jgi:hypothetical protein